MREFIVELGMMSMRASVVVGVVLILRGIFDKLHIAKKYMVLLWIIPFLCFVLPWRVESDFSAWRLFGNVGNILVQYEEEGQQDKGQQDKARQGGIADNGLNAPVGEFSMQELTNESGEKYGMVTDSGNPRETLGEGLLQTEQNDKEKASAINRYQILVSIWSTGSLFLLAYGIGVYNRLQGKVLCSKKIEGNIYSADDISTPFVLGVVKPKIYIPSNMKQKNMRYVIEHERTHIMRKDYLWKLVACLVVCIHWFNPIAWMAFRLWEKDIEMACDEETISRIGADSRWDYANVLLLISSSRKELSELFVAFGEVDTKGRIENILKDKNTVKWIAVVAVVLVGILGAVFLTKPADKAVVEETIVETTASVDAVKENETTEGITSLDKALLLEGAEEVELTPAAKISTNTISGADGPIFDYLDTEWFERIVFHDYYGLFVYDMEPMGGIVGSIDLASIGCDQTQGDVMCEVKVTEDGQLVYLKPANAKEGYIYDIEENKLYCKEYQMSDVEGFNQFEDINKWLEPDEALRSNRCVKFDDKYHYLTSGSGLPIDLSWEVVEYSAESGIIEGWQCQYVFADYSQKIVEGQTLAEIEAQLGEANRYSFMVGEEIKQFLDGEEELSESKRLKLIHMIEEYNDMVIALEEQIKYTAEVAVDDTVDNAEMMEQITTLEESIIALKKHAQERVRLLEGNTWLSTPLAVTMGDYLTISLPEGLTMGAYSVDFNGGWDGCVFQGDMEAPMHGDMCEEARYAPGGAGVTLAEKDLVAFENGRLSGITWLLNHSEKCSGFEYVDGCNMQAVLCEMEFDVFTIAEAEYYKKKHNLTDEEMQYQSHYWYVFFAEEDSDYIYTLFLNQQYYDKEDAIELARSVKFVQ